MNACPHCHFENETGALFCEQCKSDLGWVDAKPIPIEGEMESVLPAAIVAESVALSSGPPEAIVVADPLGAAMAAVAEAAPAFATAESITLQSPFTLEAQPVPEATAAVELTALPTDKVEPAPVSAEAGTFGEPEKLPAGSKPKLVVVRGQRLNAEYEIYDGDNYIGRADDKPVDVDLEEQEPPDRIWSSRQHAVISFEDGSLAIEDLKSLNGTFVNRSKIEPGKKLPLKVNDVIQIGTVQLKIKL